MITIDFNNTGNVLSKQKAIYLFEYANKATQMIKSGHVLIDKHSSEIFHIKYENKTIGQIQIIRKGNKIKNYITTLLLKKGIGYLKIPHTYTMRSQSSKDLSPMYEEWTYHTIENSADLNISYKIVQDEGCVHAYDIDVLNYGKEFKIKNINARLMRKEHEANQELYFNRLSLSYIAFTQQDFFIELFGTTDFIEALNSPNYQSNLDVIKMCEI
jgi:hypothetical protein